MIKSPFETRSDSFYFVDDVLIMHNKADYAYNGGLQNNTSARPWVNSFYCCYSWQLFLFKQKKRKINWVYNSNSSSFYLVSLNFKDLKHFQSHSTFLIRINYCSDICCSHLITITKDFFILFFFLSLFSLITWNSECVGSRERGDYFILFFSDDSRVLILKY